MSNASPAISALRQGTEMQVFLGAFSNFLSEERVNILTGVSERNLCGRFAPILEREAKKRGFSGYYADVEYNRKQDGKVKTILDERMQVVRVCCDLILHTRGDSITTDNLIAIEMKKANRSIEEKEEDRRRLRALTKSSYDGVWSNDGTAHPEHVCGYRLGVFVEVDRQRRLVSWEYFAGGRFVRPIQKRTLAP